MPAIHFWRRPKKRKLLLFYKRMMHFKWDRHFSTEPQLISGIRLLLCYSTRPQLIAKPLLILCFSQVNELNEPRPCITIDSIQKSGFIAGLLRANCNQCNAILQCSFSSLCSNCLGNISFQQFVTEKQGPKIARLAPAVLSKISLGAFNAWNSKSFFEAFEKDSSTFYCIVV